MKLTRRGALMAAIGSLFGGKSAIKEVFSNDQDLKYALGAAGQEYSGGETAYSSKGVDSDWINTRV